MLVSCKVLHYGELYALSAITASTRLPDPLYMMSPGETRTKTHTTDYFQICHNLFNRERNVRNVLFNDALNTFYLRLYGVRHMVKDHSDSEKGNPLPPHRLLLSINSKGSFICTIPQTG